MAGAKHQALVRLFEEFPDVVRQLIEVPEHFQPTQLMPTDLTDLQLAELHADAVVRFGNEPDCLTVIVEIQLQPDPAKRRSWPQYVAGAWARTRGQVRMVVVTVDLATADWCRQPIELNPTFVLRPTVVGPRELRTRLDDVSAREHPELVWLNALAQADVPDAGELTLTALRAVERLDDELSCIFADILMASLSDATRRAVEKLMATGNYEPQYEMYKKHFGLGREQGRAEASRRALLLVIDNRGLVLDPSQRARIDATDDTAVLEAWLAKAANAAMAAEVFED